MLWKPEDMFLKEKYTSKRHASYTKTNSCYVSYIYIQFEVFKNTDFVFFAYLKEKLNTAGSFRVFTLYY